MVHPKLAVASVHVRSWQEAYAGLLPASVLDSLDPVRRAARYTFGADDRATVVAVEDGRVCGFATSGNARDDDAAGCGEVMAIYLDPVFLGQGVGRALIADARGRLAARLFDVAVLWVMDGNERAMRFYERDGWRRDGAQRPIEIEDVTVGETRFRRHLSITQPV